MIGLIYKYCPLLFLVIVIFLLESCGSITKVSALGSRNDYSKVLYVFDDRTYIKQLDTSILKSYYTIEGNKLYARIRYIDKNTPSYNFITYLVAKISQKKVLKISSFTIDASVHPGTIRYYSKAGSAKVISGLDTTLILSMNLKSERINSVLDNHLKNILILFNKISLKKVGNLSILKSYDNNWKYAETIRKRDFKAY